MTKTLQVRCPNCGSPAKRFYFLNNQITETSCPVCDYLMVNCSVTGKVLESYAPGIAVMDASRCTPIPTPPSPLSVATFN
ncbi:MAG: hypothetical protein IGR93_17200 [Hydrococcus sp. C42_A2020_068]|uniref:hypothetical protein n=1 Tax=Pleurocapsa sp. PCC 7327 TaxID=118163 RepID=UPI00029FE28A|nr:hypothetical protein [Pleurocapsa sp. PCC 7327]AFY75911.1 hypothetical protein Ple7327_0455 [Pleurocapsa sp. PCC 7327]MBF2021781.1 hypothetical protein [Hydrococcus sp. C42_A2020_068]